MALGRPPPRGPTAARARCALALALAGAACVEPPRPLRLPDDGALADARAMLVVYEDPAGVTGVFTTALPDPRPVAAALGPADVLSLFLYSDSLESLALPSGVVAAPEPGAPSRPVPAGATAAYRAEGGGPEGRVLLRFDPAALGPALRALRLPGVAVEACAERGGCNQLAAGASYCELPCREPAPAVEPSPPEQPAPPQAAELPRLWPCPEGWSEGAAVDGMVTCVPPDMFGSVCPQAQWSEALIPPGRPTRYVTREAGPGGDGTRARPFGRIADALLGAPDGAVVVVGKGRFLEQLVVTSSVTIVGACADGISGTAVLSVEARGPGLQLRNLRIESAFGIDGVVQGPAAGPISVEDSIIEVSRRAVVAAPGGTIDLRRVAIRTVGVGLVAAAPGAEVRAEGLLVDGTEGVAVEVSSGGAVALRGALLRAIGASAVRAEGPSEVSLAQVHVAGTGPTGIEARGASTVRMADVVVADVPDGAGLAAHVGATLDGERVLVARARQFGVYGAHSRLAFRDLHVVDTDVRPSGDNGEAVVVDLSTLVLERARLDGAYGGGLTIIRSFTPIEGCATCAREASAVVRDLVVRDILYREFRGEPGNGVEVGWGGALTLSRARVEDLDGTGLILANERRAADTALVADLTVRRTGQGVKVVADTHATLERVRVEHTAGDGVSLVGGAVTMNDLSVVAVGGVGLSYLGDVPSLGFDYGRFTLRRAALETPAGVGIAGDAASRGARPSLAAEDLRVVDPGGAGMSVQFSDVTLTRARITGARGLGACFFAGLLQAGDLEVEASRPAESAGCAGGAGEASGLWIGARGPADDDYATSAELRRFRVAAHPSAGLVAGRLGALRLHQGWVEDDGVGVRVARDRLGAQALEDGVIFRRNGEDLRVE